MILLDSNVLTDFWRGHPPAIEWFASLDESERLVLPGFARMELVAGAKNSADMAMVLKIVNQFPVVWPTSRGYEYAVEMHRRFFLSHGVKILDMLLAGTAFEFDLVLYTFDKKHMSMLPGIMIAEPYNRNN